jgi:hypothetical protein
MNNTITMRDNNNINNNNTVRTIISVEKRI